MAIAFAFPYEKPIHIWPSLIEGEGIDLWHKKKYHFFTYAFYMYEEPSNALELINALSGNKEWNEKFEFMREHGANIEMQAAPSYMNHSIKVGFWARFPTESSEIVFLLKYGAYKLLAS